MKALDSNQSNGFNNNLQSQNQDLIPFLSKEKEFESTFKVWSKYEDIAMHFNELIIKLRVQALGGLTLSGTLATAIFKNDSNSLKLLLAFFLAAWMAIYFLDIQYYDRLLSGAVKELIVLENKLENIKLSTKIEEEIRSNQIGRWAFYGIIFIALLLINIFLWEEQILNILHAITLEF